MLATTKLLDPWSQTMFLLSGENGLIGNYQGLPDSEKLAGRVNTSVVCATVKVIERPSTSSAIVEWRDPTHCSYGDQTWRLSRAQRDGVCAMSGKPISRNSLVYRPFGRPMPCNADAMIRADELEREPVN